MKPQLTILNSLGAAALLPSSAACSGSGPSYDPDSPKGEAYVYRHAVMEVADAKARVLTGMARGETALDEAAFVKAATDLAALSTMMIDGFRSPTLVEESRTDPAVWENWDDFERRLDDFVEAAGALAAAAESGGFAAAQEQVQPAIQSCGGCHRLYRLPKRESDR